MNFNYFIKILKILDSKISEEDANNLFKYLDKNQSKHISSSDFFGQLGILN